MASSPIDTKRYEKLFAITGELQRLKLNPKTLDKNDYLTLLEQLCNAVKSALDAGLKDVLATLGTADADAKAKAKQIIEGMRLHTEFIALAENALTKCHVEKVTAKAIVDTLSEMRNELEASDFNAGRAASAVDGFRDHVCRAEIQVRYRLSQKQANFIFRRLGMATAGLVLLVAAGSVAYSNDAKATPESVALGTVATALLAASTLENDPTKRKPRKT